MSILIYNLVQAKSTDDIISKLNPDPSEIDIDYPSFKAATNFPLTNPKEIVAHHKTRSLDDDGEYCDDGEDCDDVERILLIVDRLPVEEKGVLVVCANFDSAPDAIRMPLDTKTGRILNSLIIETREGTETKAEAAMRPTQVFAIYNLLPKPNEEDTESRKTIFEAIIHRLENGMAGICMRSHVDYGRKHRNIYVGLPGNANTVDDIKANHVNTANDNHLDQTMFAVVDADWKEKGLLFVRIGGDKIPEDGFRHKGPKAGELLNWIWMGLLNWDQAKVEKTMEWPEKARHPLAI